MLKRVVPVVVLMALYSAPAFAQDGTDKLATLILRVYGPNGLFVDSEALLPSGERIICTPEDNKDLFHAMIGGMGLLGVFTSITLQIKQIHSGQLRVLAWAKASLKKLPESYVTIGLKK